MQASTMVKVEVKAKPRPLEGPSVRQNMNVGEGGE